MSLSWASILLWGFVATATMTTVMALSVGLGLSRMSIPFMLGTMVTPNRLRAPFYGFAIHMMNGWAFSLVYAAAFEGMGRATWWIGAIAGAVHGLFILAVAMPFLPGLHPRMASETTGPEPTKNLEPPGFLALNYGRRTPMFAMLAHLVYGTILGAFYQVGG